MAQREKKKSVKMELLDVNHDRFRPGRSKYNDKIADRRLPADTPKTEFATRKYWYMRKTFDDYIKTSVDFVHYARKEAGVRLAVDSEEIKKYLPAYIDKLNTETKEKKDGTIEYKYSPRTVQMFRTHLAKTFQIDLTSVPIRHCTSESDKGRGVDLKRWNPACHQEEIEFYTSIGARKGEYRFVNYRDLNKLDNQKVPYPTLFIDEYKIPNIQPIYRDGLVVKVQTLVAKHGKSNIAEILPSKREYVTKMFESGKYMEYFNPPNDANVHQCRRDYAQALYDYYARDITSLDRKEVYITRDGTCRHFDKKALEIVSHSLGHGNDRGFNVVHCYLR